MVTTTTAATTNRRKNATTTSSHSNHSNNNSAGPGKNISSISKNRSNGLSLDDDGGRGGDSLTAPTTRSPPAASVPRRRFTKTTIMMIYRIGWGLFLVSSFMAISLGVRENRTGRYVRQPTNSIDRLDRSTRSRVYCTTMDSCSLFVLTQVYTCTSNRKYTPVARGVTIEGIQHFCADNDDRNTNYYRLFVNVMAAHPDETDAVVVCCDHPVTTTKAAPSSAGDGDNVETESPLCIFKVRHTSMDVCAGPFSSLVSPNNNIEQQYIHERRGRGL
jgi:hypothetical protein